MHALKTVVFEQKTFTHKIVLNQKVQQLLDTILLFEQWSLSQILQRNGEHK